MRRRLVPIAVVASRRWRCPRAALAHDQPETDQSTLGHGRLDDGHVLRLLGPRARRVPRGVEGGRTSTSSTRTRRSRCYVEEEDYYTPEWALAEEEWARMTMPSGNSPQTTHRRTTTTCSPTTRTTAASTTWHGGLGLARLDVGLRGRARRVILICWVWQYRTTRQRSAASTRSTAGASYTTEARRPGYALLPRAHRRSLTVLRGRAHHRPPRLGADLLMASAPLPFVSYSSLTEVVVPAIEWPEAVRLAAGAQGPRPGVPRLPALRRLHPAPRTTASVRIHCYTTWDTPGQLEAFLERGYTLERLLADFGDSRARSGASSWRRSSDGATPRRPARPLARLSRRRRGRPPLARRRSAARG